MATALARRSEEGRCEARAALGSLVQGVTVSTGSVAKSNVSPGL